MHLREIRRQCRDIIATAPIPYPFDVRECCRAIAEMRGQPIELRGMTMPPEGPSGMWIPIAGQDFILFDNDTTPLHQEHIIMHELAHVLSDHAAALSPTDIASTDPAVQLLPHLDPALIHRVLRRTAYSADEERMAETLASMILETAHRWKPVSEWEGPPHAADLRRRIHLTIEATGENPLLP
jgi:hypothetical protein